MKGGFRNPSPEGRRNRESVLKLQCAGHFTQVWLNAHCPYQTTGCGMEMGLSHHVTAIAPLLTFSHQLTSSESLCHPVPIFPSRSHQTNLTGPNCGPLHFCPKDIPERETLETQKSGVQATENVSILCACVLKKVTILDLSRMRNKPWNTGDHVLFPILRDRSLPAGTTSPGPPLPGSAASAAPWWPLLGLPSLSGRTSFGWKPASCLGSWGVWRERVCENTMCVFCVCKCKSAWVCVNM